EGGAILLDEQALRILKKIEEPIAVITVGVVVIDCEGIDDPNQEAPWANKLIILCLAISSTLIYNINGIIGRDDIEKLFLMTKIVSLIQPPNDYQYLPNLVVLLRDGQLDSPHDFVEYFLDRLSKVDYDDPIFVEKIEEAVTNIFEDLPPKYLNASTMSGITFAEFLERCVVQINDPSNTMLSIPSAYEATINYAAQKAYETCIELYNGMMNEMSIKGFPISWDEFEEIHNIAFESALKNFIKQIVGSADQIQSFQKTFHDKITASKNQFYMKNSTAMSKYHEEWAHKLWKKNVAPGLEIENLFVINNFFYVTYLKIDTDKFEEAIKLFEQSYESIVMPGQEAIQVLTEFKSNQYEDAIKLLNIYGILREERANEMLALKSMEECLRNQKQQSQQAIDHMKIENERMLKEQNQQNQQAIRQLLEDNERKTREQKKENQRLIDQQKAGYERMLKEVRAEHQSTVNSLQSQLNKNVQKKSSFLDGVKEVAATIEAQRCIPKGTTGLLIAKQPGQIYYLPRIL
ncbi:5416_t:CDS:2, partial [Racocetra fulgida]